MNEKILERIAEYVTTCFNQDIPPYLYYHNLSHTQEVVARSEEIATYYKLSEEDVFVLLAAAWFHDLGQLYTKPEAHEEKSVALMNEFLKHDCTPQTLHSIASTILATKYPTRPNTFIEEIICDADTYHFGTGQFLVTDVLVKKEMEIRTGVVFTDWNKVSLDLLKSHHFYTDYCKERLTSGKQVNIELMERKEKKY